MNVKPKSKIKPEAARSRTDQGMNYKKTIKCIYQKQKKGNDKLEGKRASNKVIAKRLNWNPMSSPPRSPIKM